MASVVKTTLSVVLPLVSHAAIACATQVFEVEIDLTSQREGTTVVRTLEIDVATDLVFDIAGASRSDVYSVSVRVDGIEMPTIAFVPLALSSINSTAGTFSHVSRGIRSAGDSVNGSEAARMEASAPSYSMTSALDPVPGVDSTRSSRGERLPGAARIQPGQRMTVVVRRATAPADRAWTIVFVTPPRGMWRISFGFAFAIMVNADKEYVARRDTGYAYSIQRQADPSPISAIPMCMIHWFANVDQWKDWSWSVAAGMGLDVSSPAVMLGGSLTYNQNISMAAGVVAMKLKRLNSKYAEGARLTEDPGEEQLHRPVYGVNPFVSLSFRFTEMLFGK